MRSVTASSFVKKHTNATVASANTALRLCEPRRRLLSGAFRRQFSCGACCCFLRLFRWQKAAGRACVTSALQSDFGCGLAELVKAGPTKSICLRTREKYFFVFNELCQNMQGPKVKKISELLFLVVELLKTRKIQTSTAPSIC